LGLIDLLLGNMSAKNVQASFICSPSEDCDRALGCEDESIWSDYNRALMT